jgi:hypothetical protein
MLNQEASIKQAKKLARASKAVDEKPITLLQALDQGRKEKGITKTSETKIKGGKGVRGLYDVR